MPLYQVQAGDRILAADLNQLYNLLKGVAASGETITLIYNNQALILQPSADPSAGTRVVLIKNTAGTVLATWRYDGLIELLSAATAPATPVAGSVYWDNVLVALRVYDGTNWRNTAESPTSITGLWQWNFIPGMAVQTTFVGTGSYAVDTGYSEGQLHTGGTSASSAGLKLGLGAGAAVGGMNNFRYWSFSIYLNQVDANTDFRHYLTNEDAVTQPSNTIRHVGIRATTSSTVLFTTADGTTEQTTDISTWLVAAAERRVVITFDGTTARCYITGTLRATHATNVPTAAATPVAFVAFITNSAAADKVARVQSNFVQFAS